ncbi:molybdenum cofactor guanylyltransferase [Dethiobacter alkaliphilus]|uniref:molybdenum cofactor guanylyltransferase n=1 Tax=Dethiobacter alkaliphilus TaxID=427926 RepID=UPI0022264F6F|nr:molybdenum cofactor guanylyltransferase [Dethiobacter alkaliphilus]MCW3489148.1 molybdenum cofactor guanylyltransferase [Dethiobacter alkaliphilus]
MNPAKMSAVILAGGKSSRMGRDKLLLPLGGKPLISHVLDTLQGLFAECILVTDRPQSFSGFAVRVTEDLIRRPEKNSLAGIHAGLSMACHDYVLAVAGDMPFINRDVLLYLCSRGSDEDVVIFRDGPHFQPLCAIYHKNCLPHIEDMLNKGHYKVADFFPSVRVREVDVSSLQPLDPGRISFFNVNAPEDYEKARALIAGNYNLDEGGKR